MKDLNYAFSKAPGRSKVICFLCRNAVNDTRKMGNHLLPIPRGKYQEIVENYKLTTTLFFKKRTDLHLLATLQKLVYEGLIE